MTGQNIYDDDIFFEGFKKIRYKKVNHNDLIETPAIFSLLPKLKNKVILDLGCGFGINCKKFIDSGAKKVIGIDISKKMINYAEKENYDKNITYLNIPMENINKINLKFDLVVSSLAIQYVEDYSKLVLDIYNLLSSSGEFIFSMEHPLFTSQINNDRWIKDSFGNKEAMKIYSYGEEYKRISNWLLKDIEIYHRTFSTVLNTLIENGFKIEKILEPLASKEIIEKYPEFRDTLMCPNFLLIKSVKE